MGFHEYQHDQLVKLHVAIASSYSQLHCLCLLSGTHCYVASSERICGCSCM